MRALALMVLVSSVAFAEGGVSAVRSALPRLDAHKRGKLTPAPRFALEALGPAAVPDMIAAFDQPEGELTDSAYLAWQASLLEALGTQRDRRALPLFERVVRDHARPYLLQRAAAEGLAKLGELETLSALIDRDAVVAGIGSLRRFATARLLAGELAKHPPLARAKLMVKALGEAGNAWAWKTLANREEEQATRNEAARALVGAFVAYDGEVRQAASTALLVVDAAAAPALIAQAKTRGSVTELDALQTRLLKNPLR